MSDEGIIFLSYHPAGCMCQVSGVPVCQRGDDQSVCAAQVFVAVAELHICDLDDTSVCFLQEVKP